MKRIQYTPKQKWITLDDDGTAKLFRLEPRKVEGKWIGKGCQVMSPEKVEGIELDKDCPVICFEMRQIAIIGLYPSQFAM